MGDQRQGADDIVASEAERILLGEEPMYDLIKSNLTKIVETAYGDRFFRKSASAPASEISRMMNSYLVDLQKNGLVSWFSVVKRFEAMDIVVNTPVYGTYSYHLDMSK